MNSHEVFIHIHQGCFAGTGAIVRLPQCQWSKPDGYGKISQCITTTKHSKAKTVCIFLGIYCKCNFTFHTLRLLLLWSTCLICKHISHWAHPQGYMSNSHREMFSGHHVQIRSRAAFNLFVIKHYQCYITYNMWWQPGQHSIVCNNTFNFRKSVFFTHSCVIYPVVPHKSCRRDTMTYKFPIS